MSDTLTVILGAGASFDCTQERITDFSQDYWPPLVNELFAFRLSFNKILRKYPRAEALSEEIRTKLEAGVSLEALLRQLASEDNFAIKKQYWEIPLYLQELLGEVSEHFVRFGGTKYDTLVRAIARSTFQEVLFLTVNYDLFLDDALKLMHGVTFSTLDSYCPKDSGWSLIKLHGSVNWGKKLLTPHNPIPNSVELLNTLDGEIELDQKIQILSGHHDESRFIGSDFFYPSLAVPIEGKDEFACPEEHIQKAKSFLKFCSNFIIIGFSALDEHVLKQLEAVQYVRKLMVVNGSEASALEAIRRIASKNMKFSHENYPDCLYAGGFRDFMTSGELDRFLGS